jgi:lysozyme family protein
VTQDQFIEMVLDEEGRVYEEPPKIDQPTGPGGVTLPELCTFRGTKATVDDLKVLSIDEAKRIIAKRFIDPQLQAILDEHLRVQVLDYAYNSGKATAVRWLQRTANSFLSSARSTADALNIDGIVGSRTLAIINSLPPLPLNNALAGERAHAAYHGGTQPKFAAGVAHRAIEFIVALTS